MGLYSSSQFFGIFVGGVLGGWLYGKFGFSGVYLFCIILTLLLLTFAVFMRSPRYLATQIWKISPKAQHRFETIAATLRDMPGIVEVTFVAKDNVAYVKMERRILKHPDLIHLKQQLQPE